MTEGEEAVVHSAGAATTEVGWFCSSFGSWVDLTDCSVDRGTETEDEEDKCLVGDEDESFCDVPPESFEYLRRM